MMQYLVTIFTYYMTTFPLGEYPSFIVAFAVLFYFLKINWWLNELDFSRPTVCSSFLWGPQQLSGLVNQWLPPLLSLDSLVL